MNKDELGIEIHNKEELLRVYENNKKNTEDTIEKSKWDKCIIKVSKRMFGNKSYRRTKVPTGYPFHNKYYK